LLIKATHSTGATGYIGGDALYALYNKHPEYEYSALIRTEKKGTDVKKAFPNVRIVIGDLDSSAVIEEEAGKADVVIRMFLSIFSHSLPT
jgi:N-acetyl-gamma-glutamylphosphate reductase